MHATTQLRFDLPEPGLPALTHRLPNQHEDVPLPRLATDVGKAEEVERLWLALAPARPLFGRVTTELDQPGLVRVQRQTEPRQPLAQLVQELLGLRSILEPQDGIVGKAHHDHVAARLP